VPDSLAQPRLKRKNQALVPDGLAQPRLKRKSKVLVPASLAPPSLKKQSEVTVPAMPRLHRANISCTLAARHPHPFLAPVCTLQC
jgi:hypothetical protein